ncbi:MAG: hypothetical protein ACQER6_10145 [Pseudomonadota bacterium]
MSGYRDWEPLPGSLPEGAPDRLVDAYTIPGLIETGAEEVPPAAAEAGLSPAWLLPLVLLVIVAGWWLWRRRRELRLARELRRLERSCRRSEPAQLRARADGVIVAIGCWQHGRPAPQRDRLAAPWSDWVREIDHARFGSDPALDADWLVTRLRLMRRQLWQRGGAR